MKLDTNKVKELVKKNGMNQSRLAEAVGVDPSTISNYLSGRKEPTTPVLNSICFVLGCKKEDLELVEVKTEKSAAGIIADGMAAEEIVALKREINALRLDLQNTAKMLLEINKTCKETKAQEELNAEELRAIFNKVTDCSSGINKVSGSIKKRTY